jgi:hypothetical protein
LKIFCDVYLLAVVRKHLRLGVATRAPGKAAVNAPQSRRFARFADDGQSRQRLEWGGFSTAFVQH